MFKVLKYSPIKKPVQKGPCALENSIFSRTDYMLGHKTSLNKFEIKIIPSIFSDHNAWKLEINCKKEVKTPRQICGD